MSRVPPHVSGGHPRLPGDHELEHLEELGDDAIIAELRAPHAPVPRAQVTEDARSIVISEHPSAGAESPPAGRDARDSSGKKRSSRTEKTVVIRDRRQIDALRRQMSQRAPAMAASRTGGVLLWVIVGVLAFLTGGVAALLATRDESSATSAVKAVVSEAPPPTQPPATATVEPPKVSIDELPIEGKTR